MSDQPAPGGHLIAPLVFFVFASIIAMCLFIGAFVMWLASLIGSIAVAALITAGFFAVLALVIYFLSVRTAVAQLRDRLDTVYDVAMRVRAGYNWLSDKFSFLSFLHRAR